MISGASISISGAVCAAMSEHAQAAYPEECCGVLVGGDGSLAAVAMQNVAPQRARRYLMDGREWLKVEREAGHGAGVVGVYHSHCDGEAVPSEFDVATAWPVYVYVIVSVMGGRAAGMRAWRLREDGAGFGEIEILCN
jgi:proteasome lid subunit RPN8/RPN11